MNDQTKEGTKGMRNQLNLNTLILSGATIIFGVVADVGCHKMDSTNTNLIQHELLLKESRETQQKLERLTQDVLSKQSGIELRLIDFERQIKDLVTRGEFNSEVNRIHQEVDFLKRKS